MEQGRLVYRAAASNPYGLPGGAYAGYLFAFDDQTGETSGQGLALAAEVRRVLLTRANSPEAIAHGNWKMTFPFDPHGAGVEIGYFEKLGLHAIVVNGLDPDTKFWSPFLESTIASSSNYSTQGVDAAGLTIRIPELLLQNHLRGINLGITIYSRRAEALVQNTETTVEFGELLVTRITVNLLPNPPFPESTQVVMNSNSLEGSKDLRLDRILEVDGSPVFGLEK
jgi:hypothetical protein